MDNTQNPTRMSVDEIFEREADANLARAAADGDTAGVRRWLDAGADVDAIGKKGVSPLLWALAHDSEAGVIALLEAGADATHADAHGETALHLAARADDPRLLQALIAREAPLDVRDERLGRTPLFHAIMAEREPQFEALVAAGADLDAQDNMGNTPLHAAAKIHDYARVLQLLQAGAAPGATNKVGVGFQRYLAIGPAPGMLSEQARLARQRIDDWLVTHDVALEGGADRNPGHSE